MSINRENVAAINVGGGGKIIVLPDEVGAYESVGEAAAFRIKNEVKGVFQPTVASNYHVLPYCVTVEERSDGGTLLRKILAFIPVGKNGTADTKVIRCRIAVQIVDLILTGEGKTGNL